MNRAVEGCRTVFHLGAIISIPYSYVSPNETHRANVYGTLNVLNACRAYDVARLIHTSTSEVYGTAQYVPIDEKHPLVGQSPYSASKIAADQLVDSFYRSFGLPTTTVRPFNTFGPRQSARAVIPTIAVQLLTDKTLKIGSLTPTRDFTFVADTVMGFIKAAETPEAVGKVLNLGTGVEISIGDLAQKLSDIVGVKFEIQTDENRQRPKLSEVNRLLSNNQLAKTTLNWAPTFTFDEGLRQTVDWLRGELKYYQRAQSQYLI